MQEELILFDKDMRWTRIHEFMKLGAPISPDDRQYYEQQLGLVAQAKKAGAEEAFIKGFIAGFDHSGEGYNGEYTKGKVTDEMLRERAIEALSHPTGDTE